MLNKLLIVVFLLMVARLQSVCCSIGDRLNGFQSCLATNKPKCQGSDYPAVLPWYLTIFRWTCLDELKYQCMHNTTQYILESEGKVYQYYGKWPFVRLCGIQEPASTIFSLGNLAANVLGWRLFSKKVTDQYKFHQPTKLYFFVSVNAWFWSAVFHTRDLDVTEKLDYFCASFMVMVSIFFCFTRIVGDPKDKKSILFGSLLAVVFSRHIYTMGFVKFDYGYNMKFNVFIGTLNWLMWLSWCIYERKKRFYVWKCATIVTLTFLCVGLELLDFPPLWWTFDAHSFWHLATIPLSYLWYIFLTDDGIYEVSKVKQLL